MVCLAALGLFWIFAVVDSEARYSRRSLSKWQGHVEVSGKFGSTRDIGRLDFFMPFDQGGNYLLFGDFRGVLASGTTEEGNFGLGFRQIFRRRNFGLGPLIVGMYGFYDIRSSVNSFTYHQLTPGIEFLGEHWDLRFNGYAPVSGSNVLSTQVLGMATGTGAGNLGLSGTTVTTNSFTRTDTQLVRVARERPLSGWDFEAGYGWDLWREHSLWLYGGYFDFSDSVAPSINGPRLRAEYRIDDIFRVPGARLTLGGEWQDDDVRGSQGFGMVRIRIPLEKFFGKRERRSLRDIDRRMIATIIRDIDIVTHAQNPNAPAGSADAPDLELQPVETPVAAGTATDPVTGQTLNVFFVSEGGTGTCTQASPCSLATAQANASYGAGDVVVLLSSAGNILNSITLTDARQQVVGGGNAGSTTVAMSNGGQLSLSSLGTRPTLAPVTGPAITLAESTKVRGITVQSGGIGISGSGVTGVELNDVVINGGTTGIQLQGAGSVTATNTTVQNTNGAGVELLNFTGALTYSGGITDSLGSGFRIDGGTGSVVYTGNLLQSNNAAAVEVVNGHSGTATFQNGIITATQGPGLQFANADGVYSFSGTTSLSGGLAGINITTGSNGTFNFGTGASITNRTADAFAVDGGTPNVTYSGTITNSANNMISVANTTGGTITFNSATANALNDTGSGVFLNTAGGNVNIANARLQGTEGIDIDAGTGTFTFTTSSIAPNAANSAVDIAGGSSSLTFGGSLTQANNAAAISVSGGHATGTVTFQNGTLTATNGTGLLFNDADGIYKFTGTTTLNGGDAGIDILNGSAGTFTFGSNTSITNPLGSGFTVDGGTANVTYNGGISQANNFAAVTVSGGHATGALMFATGAITATNGTGLQFNNADGTYTFTGTTTLNGGDAGIDILNGSGGTFTFGTGTTITNPLGTGFNLDGGTANVTFSGSLTQANNFAAVAVSGGHTTGAVRFQTGTISATNGTGLQFDNADGAYQFAGTTALNGGDAGIDILNASDGTFTFGSGTTITNPTGVPFNLAGGTANVTYSGGIAQNNSTAAVAISGGHATGAVRFDTGLISASNGTGLQFDNADGTYQFAGTTTLNGGDAGIDILNGSGGNFTFGTGTSITNPAGLPFNLVGGTASVTYSGNITQTNNVATVSVTGGHATGSVRFDTGTISATNGTGLQFNDADATYTFAGTTTLNGGDAGIDILNGSAGTFTFGSGTTITNPTGVPFNLDGGTASVTYSGNITQANNVAAVSVANGHTTGTVRFDTGTISATLGTGLQFDNADGIYQFAGTTTLNGGDAGIDILNGSGGNFTFGSGTSITSPTGTAFNVNTSGATVTYNGAITQANAARVVDLDGLTAGANVTFQTGLVSGGAMSTGVRINNSAGTVSFGNLDLGTLANRMTNTAVTLSGANTGTYNFSGLNVFTTGVTAFDANTGGTVQVTGAGNTLDAALGTALSVVNSTIGGLGLTFQSISGTGGGTGVLLTTTGGAGGLTVTGTGLAGTGGTLGGYTNGILGTTVLSVNLTNMNINNSATDGISLDTVTNITLNSLSISSAGDDAIAVTGNTSTLSGSGTTMTNPIGTACDTTGATITTNTLTFTDPTPTPNSTCP